MKIVLPPPKLTPPPNNSHFQDFKLLLGTQIHVTKNKLRNRPIGNLIGMGALALILLLFVFSLGSVAYGALSTLSPQVAQGFLSLLFMTGLASQIFFGITAAFAALYMSDDLELLFMSPVPLKIVFIVKSLSVLGSNLLLALLFAFLPGIFYGLLFQANIAYYFIVLIVGLGLWIMGTALAELINLIVMRIVPPHRSKEAVGFIGALAGIFIALIFQIPNLALNNEGEFNINAWLTGQESLFHIMNYFPWGWGSLALVKGMSGNMLSGLGWSLFLLLISLIVFGGSFILVERGFRQGFISLSEGDSRRTKKSHKPSNQSTKNAKANEGTISQLKPSILLNSNITYSASIWPGVWAIAKKDLLFMKRDSREWFGYLAPLIIMAFFIGQYFLSPGGSNSASLVTILVMYTIMFSGNMALQSFGKEGESEWLLNSVPLAGWPVVWGKLIASVLPTLVLMEALLVGTAIAVGVSPLLTVTLGVAAIFFSLGSSAIGLFYSINNSRYNPDKPQQRISPSASLIMYLVNFLFILILSLGLSYLFLPDELVSMIRSLPPVTYEGGFWSGVIYGLYLTTRPLLWSNIFRITLGILLTLGVWSTTFFGFMAATVKQSQKGFKVELVTNKKKKK